MKYILMLILSMFCITIYPGDSSLLDANPGLKEESEKMGITNSSDTGETSSASIWSEPAPVVPPEADPENNIFVFDQAQNIRDIGGDGNDRSTVYLSNADDIVNIHGASDIIYAKPREAYKVTQSDDAFLVTDIETITNVEQFVFGYKRVMNNLMPATSLVLMRID